jgi:hypothetical protein
MLFVGHRAFAMTSHAHGLDAHLCLAVTCSVAQWTPIQRPEGTPGNYRNIDLAEQLLSLLGASIGYR